MVQTEFALDMPQKRTKFRARLKEVSLKIMGNVKVAGKRIKQLMQKKKSEKYTRNINCAAEQTFKKEESSEIQIKQIENEEGQQELILSTNYNALDDSKIL